MTVTALPVQARWVGDARDRTRAVRGSTHAAQGLLHLSTWRDDLCVGTVQLRQDAVAGLVSGPTDGLARLATSPPPAAGRVTVADLESRLPASRPSGAARLRALAARVGEHLPSALRGRVPPVHSGG
jgi:hypothetical protein